MLAAIPSFGEPQKGKEKKTPDKNFGLTSLEFSVLAAALREGDQRLFELTFLRHFEDCSLYLVTQDGLSPEKAYDASMETLLKFRQLIIENRITYGNLRYLFTLMARQEAGRETKKSAKIVSLINAGLDSIPDPDFISSNDYDLLTRAFKQLGKDCRHLLREFYYNKRQLKAIALSVERTPESIRQQKSRCLALLRRYYHHLSQ